MCFAQCALLNNQNQFLIRINNKVKVRRSTKSAVLGKTKVMSFDDIEMARAVRAAKEVIKSEGKHSLKYKSIAIEADEPEAETELEVAYIFFIPRNYRL
jgi:hypothetical protein